MADIKGNSNVDATRIYTIQSDSVLDELRNYQNTKRGKPSKGKGMKKSHPNKRLDDFL